MTENEELGPYNFSSLNDQQIADDEGKTYTLFVNTDGAVSVHVWLIYEDWLVRTRAGVSKWIVRSSEVLELADIVLDDSPVLLGRGLFKLVPYRLRHRIRSLNFRGKGLGSKMLDLMIVQAQREGFERIVAHAVAKDTPFERLLPWYARHGFHVPDPPYDEHLTNAGGVWIERPLSDTKHTRLHRPKGI
jgi:GNAT superfamily N-acetyltransferase